MGHVFGPIVETQSLSIPLVKLRTKFFCTFRTNAVAELSFRMLADITLNLIPITFVVTYFLAVGANAKHAA